MKNTLAILLSVISLAGVVHADVVTLKNGDRITGSLVSIQGGTLQLKTDYLGTVSVPAAALASYVADKPVAVIVSGQQPVQGILKLLASGDWQVTANDQAQTIAASKVQLIMPAGNYQKLIAEAPKPWQAWHGGASLGYSAQNGNQQTNTLTTTIATTRERPATPIFERHTRTNFNFTTLLSHAHEDGNTVTSRTVTAALREDYLLTPDNFVFVFAQANHVSTQGLYLQQTYGGGFGRNLIRNARTSFSILAGPTYVQEKFFNGQLNQTAELLAGETVGEQFTKRIRLDHYFNVYPDLVHGGEYRFDTSTTVSLRLLGKFSVNTSLIDLYLSNPPAGNEKNNVTFSTGIGYSF